MRILADTLETIHHLPFINAARGGGAVGERLPFLLGRAEGLPAEIAALVLTSDLQGVASSWRHGGANVLLGVEVAEVLADLAEAGTIPDPSETGVVLAGDLFSAPAGDKRGASGDVREVWMAFAALNRWVVGVGGNHDRFGSERDEHELAAQPNVEILDGRIAELDGFRVGGVGFVIGNPMKPGRRQESEFLAALALIAESSPDVVVLHEGPSGSREQRGNSRVREIIEASAPPFVVCGHVHWEKPLATLGQTQVANVDARVLIVTR